MAHRRFLIGILLVAAALTIVAMTAPAALATGVTLTPKEQLGKMLFFDTNLSDPAGQSCAACHAPKVGWTGPDQWVNLTGGVYPGAVPDRFGNRKPPASAYAGDSPILHWDGTKWIGGMFWDGRATGETLGDPLAEQAQGPFLNPLEQNNASPQVVVEKVKASGYAGLFEEVWAPVDWSKTSVVYEQIARSIAEYERSAEVNPFTSKYDAWKAGKAAFTAQEKWGYNLFTGKGKCANCHVEPLFTDFTYDNLGIPKNWLNPFYREPAWNPDGFKWVDTGLGGFLKEAGKPESVWGPEWGKQKVPTLRNVDKRPYSWFVKCYGHNGYFKSLWSIVHFYNTRDVTCWPRPEVPVNVNTTEMGNLGLTWGEEVAIVAFLKTLNDGYMPAPCH